VVRKQPRWIDFRQFIDLDGFKSIYDSLGHSVRDNLLKVCAERLGQDLRRNDMLARLGGDEFVIVVENILDTSSRAAVANGLLRRLGDEIVVNGLPLRVSASIGISFFPIDGRNVADLLHSADAAMYAAKHSGRAGGLSMQKATGARRRESE
jgi:diguanylate cyclase (GGDEF)-like protein